MTEDNKKENIRAEMERASRILDAAELLSCNGFFSDAVSRLYYYLFYHIRALLLTEGLEPKTHEGALRLLGLRFIKKGILEPEISHIFSKLMKYREEADYNPAYVFLEGDFLTLREEAEAAARRIEEHLARRGYL